MVINHKLNGVSHFWTSPSANPIPSATKAPRPAGLAIGLRHPDCAVLLTPRLVPQRKLLLFELWHVLNKMCVPLQYATQAFSHLRNLDRKKDGICKSFGIPFVRCRPKASLEPLSTGCPWPAVGDQIRACDSDNPGVIREATCAGMAFPKDVGITDAHSGVNSPLLDTPPWYIVGYIIPIKSAVYLHERVRFILYIYVCIYIDTYIYITRIYSAFRFLI